MKGKLYAMVAVLAVGSLAACSHKNTNAPLSYVPANTPYLAANLKPMTADMRQSMYKQANLQIPMQVAQMRQLADKLEADHDPKAAALLRAMAKEFDGRTIQQLIKREGIDPDGLTAMYGEGMSPVIRIQLADPAAFKAFIGRLEKAWDAPVQTGMLGGTHYRQVEFGHKIRMHLVTAVEHKQAVLALLPAQADTSLLRSALGVDKPKQSIQATGKLEKLAKDRGYQPYSVAYVDLTRWPALIAGEKDPMVKALLASAPQAAAKMPASCEGDLSRIAARMPMISMGTTDVSATHLAYRLDLDLAPDIVKAFSGIDVKLPGLGKDASTPMDLAVALPVKDFRTFWTAQADAVAAKPFTCPALTGLNDGFAKARTNLMKTAMPPFNDLRGVRVVLDSLRMPAAGSGAKPDLSGQVLIASDNPQGLLAMVQMAVPPLRNLKLGADGKPVALPASLTAMAGGKPAWAAMNDHVLGVALGKGGDRKLSDLMKESSAGSGQVVSFHLDGKLYRQWLTTMTNNMTKALANIDSGNGAKAGKQAENFHRNMQNALKQAEHIDQINEKFRIESHGLVIDADMQRH